ncbi:hypothetical protein QTI24_18735 [Variovorax sp. J22P240]|uniref:hypothetical protein n=1 Tax=Variovorax sp. J22P240 TaxID=3053514 RepID=UPI00257491A8|nr:hypothetical protein [Variovorax sp. J22P240]MDM0000660.1 hypothetical protein [Variovorax sp. J22P240]
MRSKTGSTICSFRHSSPADDSGVGIVAVEHDEREPLLGHCMRRRFEHLFRKLAHAGHEARVGRLLLTAVLNASLSSGRISRTVNRPSRSTTVAGSAGPAGCAVEHLAGMQRNHQLHAATFLLDAMLMSGPAERLAVKSSSIRARRHRNTRARAATLHVCRCPR